MSQYLGDISAYALAVSQGYTGTEEEYAELMASYATVGQTAVTAAQTATTKASEAATSATTATNKASEATTAATTATTKAGEASTSASTATSAKDTAVSASQTATTKATEATTAAATATSAKTDAVAANTAAQSAKTAAQTAQAGAETAAASVEASAAQIATNAEDISQLKSEFVDVEQAVGYEIIKLQNNKTINTSGGTNITPDHMQTENNWCGCCVPCSEGDLFTITGGGGIGTRLWAFANSSGVVLEQADASAYGTNLKKTAPENSAYFAFNSRKSDSPFVYRGTKPVELFEVRPTTEDLKNIVGYTVNNLFDGIGTTSGKYVNANNGKIQDLTSYSVTDFFKVVAGATYKLPYHASGSQIAFYDINKAYVPSSGFVTTSDTFTVPDNNNIVFARWCADTANLASWALYIVPITDLRIKYIDQTEGILAGVIDAYSNGIKKIIVQSGVYDIIAEYEAKYGADYFNNYADNYNGQVNGEFDRGIWLDNIDISFESGAIVNANYTGNNQYVKSYFSAFAIDIECST